MKAIKRLCILIILLLGRSYSVLAQNKTLKESSYIISINPVYSSNIINLNYNGYDDLYLIVPNKAVKIDSIMSALSKKNNYTSESNILTTLKSKFNVYTIVKDTCKGKSKIDYVSNHIADYNNYKTAYFFPMEDSVRKYSAVAAYIIQIYNTQSKISYHVLNNNCDTFLNECRAIIKKLSR